MTVSVRLDEETEAILKKTAKVLRTNKGQVIRRSLKEYCSRIMQENKGFPYKLIEDLLDREGSGRGDLSVKGEEILREAFRRKS
ncbi:MAG: ribbon-helix-helix protein, CopG family [Nitrospirae bacterium]|nr:ribbon-helix-helix protein, CopG family [Nitrospirota bacterium]